MKRQRAMDLGIEIGIFGKGRLNAITDVEGVLVGQATLVEGEGPLVRGVGPVRTGVTVILPHGENLFEDKVRAGCFVLNGFGKSAGLHQIRELGTMETPVALTNTLNVGLVSDALTALACERNPGIGVETGTVNPVVGDINDGFLNDIQGRHVKESHVRAAIAAASGSTVAEGNSGGGTGCSCMGFKGGIGTSSRRLPARFGGWTVGVLSQTNFGGILSVNGAPVGRELGIFDFARLEASPEAGPEATKDGSCMVVIATDAPLDSRLLSRLCARAGLGLARTGFYSGNGSGDFFLAFSTAGRVSHGRRGASSLDVLSDDSMSPLFAALVEAVEESVINSLMAAETMVGRDGNRREALDMEKLATICDKYGVRGWGSRLPGAVGF